LGRVVGESLPARNRENDGLGPAQILNTGRKIGKEDKRENIDGDLTKFGILMGSDVLESGNGVPGGSRGSIHPADLALEEYLVNKIKNFREPRS